MCAVSAISNYYNPWPMQKLTEDPETKKMLLDVIRRLDELDKRLNDKECMDDEKQKFLDAIGYVDATKT